MPVYMYMYDKCAEELQSFDYIPIVILIYPIIASSYTHGST